MNQLRTFLLLAAAAAPLAAGCESGPCGEDPNVLQGSIGELYDIESDHVRTRQLDEETVVIEYFHGEDIVAKVVGDVRSFKKGSAIPLTDGSVARFTSPPTDFPEDVAAGALTFETDLKDGEQVAGCWNVKFNMDDGSQRTLSGTFETALE